MKNCFIMRVDIVVSFVVRYISSITHCTVIRVKKLAEDGTDHRTSSSSRDGQLQAESTLILKSFVPVQQRGSALPRSGPATDDLKSRVEFSGGT